MLLNTRLAEVGNMPVGPNAHVLVGPTLVECSEDLFIHCMLNARWAFVGFTSNWEHVSLIIFYA